MRKLFFGVCGQRRPRSACASAQSDQGLHCPITVSLHKGEQMSKWYFPHAQDDLNLHILRMLEGTFSLDKDHIIATIVKYGEKFYWRHTALTLLWIKINGPEHIFYNITCPPSSDWDQPVETRRLIRVTSWLTLLVAKHPVLFRRMTQILLRLCTCAGWSEPSLGANIIM